jgi:putative effector of murein hydrolase
MIDLGKHFHVHGAVLWLPCTMLLFAASSALYRRLNKAPLANPTLPTITAIALTPKETRTPSTPCLVHP